MCCDDGDVAMLGVEVIQWAVLLDVQVYLFFLLRLCRAGMLADVLANDTVRLHFEQCGRHLRTQHGV